MSSIPLARPEKLKEIILKQMGDGVTPAEVIPEAKFIDDLGFDSLDLVELVMALDDEYGIDISDEDAEKIVTFGDAVKYVEEHVESSPPPPPPRCRASRKDQGSQSPSPTTPPTVLRDSEYTK